MGPFWSRQNLSPSHEIFQVQLYKFGHSKYQKVNKVNALNATQCCCKGKSSDENEWFDVGPINEAPNYTISKVKMKLRNALKTGGGDEWPFGRVSVRHDPYNMIGLPSEATLQECQIKDGDTLYIIGDESVEGDNNSQIEVQWSFVQKLGNQPIGSGIVADVWLARWNNHFYWKDELVALKLFKEDSIQLSSNGGDDISELTLLRHPRIVQFMAISKTPQGQRGVITENVIGPGDGGSLSLYDLLHNVTERAPDDLVQDVRKQVATKLKLALDIVSGLKYLKSRHVLHLDLKPSNILINNDKRAKISDYHISQYRDEEVNDSSAPWMAPEAFELTKQDLSSAADVYSFGVILWELFTMEIPGFGQNIDTIKQNVMQGSGRPLPVASPNFPQLVVDTIKNCLKIDANERTSFIQIYDDLFRAYCDEEKVARQFICPITYDIMVNPVIAKDGKTYERKNIENWLDNYPISPITAQALDVTDLKPNTDLKTAIGVINPVLNN